MALVPLIALGATACNGGKSGSASTSPTGVTAKQELQQAKQTVDATNAVHFEVSSSGLGNVNGARITSGTGDVVRPDGFQGTMTVAGGALSGKVKVVSKGGKFYVQLPIINTWTTVDPHKYGFGDPGTLLSKSNGISSLLTSARNPHFGSPKQTRVNGDVVDVVKATLPAKQVGQVLTTADPSGTFDTEFDITPDKHQVRRVVMSGPFFTKGGHSTYTVTLTNYGENVTISAPH